MIIDDGLGGRTIRLFVPFRKDGEKKMVRAITLAAFQYGHALDWNSGRWPSSFALLVELAGGDENLIRSLRYPDADRVMGTFIEMLPDGIRQHIAEGQVPIAPQPEVTEQPPTAEADAAAVEPVPASPAPKPFDPKNPWPEPEPFPIPSSQLDDMPASKDEHGLGFDLGAP